MKTYFFFALNVVFSALLPEKAHVPVLVEEEGPSKSSIVVNEIISLHVLYSFFWL